jgi:hypothetical protein
MLDKMNELEPDVDIILVTGDMITHGVSVELEDMKHHHQYDMLKNLLEELIVNILAEKFPNAYILPTIGNNDIKYHYVAPQRNYTAPDYYPYMYNLIFEQIPKNRNLNLTGVKESFYNFGGYKIDMSDDLSFISLNSLYYNNRTPSNDTEIKVAQLDWFEKTLDNAEPGRKFVIFFHIYPGMYFIGHIRFFWERPAVLRFNDIIQRNIDKIALINGAHSHFPDIKVGFSSEFSIPLLMNTDDHFLKYIPKWTMLITPSISPVFRNNPGITLLEMEDQVPKNIVWHFMELYKFPSKESEVTFNSLRFKEDLGIDEFTPNSALRFIKTIIGNRYQLYKFLAHKIGYRGKTMAHALAEYQDLKMINLGGEFDYFCSLLNMLRTDYAN